MKKTMRKLPVILLLLIFVGTSYSVIVQKSPIGDELTHHIPAGYSYLKTLDFRYNPSAPPLIREFMGFPLLFLDLELPTDHVSWQANDCPAFSDLFFYEYNDNAGAITFWARFPMVLLSSVLGLFVFIWARELYGYKSGLLALFLFVCSPAILGNSGLAMVDMGAALFTFLSMWSFWRFLKERNARNLIFCGVLFGLAQSAKCSLVGLYPIFVILAFIEVLRSPDKRGQTLFQFKSLFAIFVIGFVVLWATYGFEFKPLLKNAPDVEEKIGYIKSFAHAVPFFGGERLAGSLTRFASNFPIPLSTYIVTLLGVIYMGVTGSQGVYFMGANTNEGSRIYYLVNFLIKTPLPLIILFLLSVYFALRRKRSPKDLMTNTFILIVPFVFFLSSSFSRLQGGIRYLLPIYPFMFVWVSDIINVMTARRKFLYFIVSVLCVWYSLIFVFVYPDYLAYYNEVVGGPGGKGYIVSRDSDWGQELPALAKYLKKNDIKDVELLYFGTARPDYYGINYNVMSGADLIRPAEKVYAVSLRYLPLVKWAQEYKPRTKIGYAVYVYDFRKN